MLGEYPLLDADVYGKPGDVFVRVCDSHAYELSLRALKTNRKKKNR
jgi:hypothetical protein